MSFNISHVNPTVKKKVFKAMLVALRRGTVEHVRTAKGSAYLAVRPSNGLYVVTDIAGKNVSSCFKAYPQLINNMVQV